MQDIRDVAETMRRDYYGRAVNPEYCLDCGEPRAIGRCEG
jgi:predicted Zn-ribbon and HTH transcriptional regulator